uniref:Microfibril associated protein 2 n=1 Tax=Hippocampus comes TaxID=109280 RepID=A0A3Q2XKH4_HIPCM
MILYVYFFIVIIAHREHPSIHFMIRFILARVAGRAGAYPSRLRAVGGGHPEPVASQSQGTQRQTTNPLIWRRSPQSPVLSVRKWNCREEQYPCTRLYSVHKPCKQCLNSLCFYSLRRVYVINKEVCVRTVCAHEELLRADLCRDQFSRCGVAALSGHCASVGASCGKSCGGGC